jgi:(1->4)-alpha-D-glucan 1-alpha-D-glucosylmutase
MLKAVREAKRHTSWLTPNQPYEDALHRFIERALTGSSGARFLSLMLPLQRRIAAAGMVNSLSQLVAKLGSPGVPDVYQGTELWDFSLVDPDNRRPVDFTRRRAIIEEIDSLLCRRGPERLAALAALLDSWTDGRIKLLTTAVGLRIRRDDPELFLRGEYIALETEISVAGAAVAFARVQGQRAALFVGPRLSARLLHQNGSTPPKLGPPLGADAWKTSRVFLPEALANRAFRHEISGADIQPTSASGHAWLFLGQIFEHVPVGILRAQPL